MKPVLHRAAPPPLKVNSERREAGPMNPLLLGFILGLVVVVGQFIANAFF